MTKQSDPVTPPAHTSIEAPDGIDHVVPPGVNVVLRPVRILIADESACAATVADVLRRVPIKNHVECVNTLDAVVDAIVAQSHDMYIVAGGSDGSMALDVIRATWERGHREPVVVLTDRVDSAIEEATRRAGSFVSLAPEELTPRRLEREVRGALASAQLRSKLAGNKDKLERLMSVAPISLFVLDAEGAPVVLEGRPVGWLAATAQVERAADDDAPMGYFEAVRSALAGDSTSFVAEADGRVHEVMMGPLTHEHYVAGAYGVAIDVTERVLALRTLEVREQFFRLLTEQAHGFLSVLTADGVIAYQSPGIEGVLGYSADAVVGRDAFALVADQDVERVLAQFALVLSGEATVGTSTWHMKHASGGVRAIEVAWRNCLADDAICGIVITARDVTERLEAEEARRKAQEDLRVAHAELELRVAERTLELTAALDQLSERHRVQRRFIADATHDLRTPLTTIRGEAELLGQLDLSSELRESLDTIRNQAERLEALSTDLLLISTLDAAGLPHRSEEFRLDEIVFDALGLLRHRTREFSAHWDVAVDDAIIVVGDQLAMTRAIANVCDNALKYSLKGATIHVRLCLEGDVARLIVTDPGVGIPDWDLGHVFDRFYRGKSSSQIAGTGLGLSIVKHVVEAHGGGVTIASVVGTGTVVSMTMPAHAEVDEGISTAST